MSEAGWRTRARARRPPFRGRRPPPCACAHRLRPRHRLGPLESQSLEPETALLQILLDASVCVPARCSAITLSLRAARGRWPHPAATPMREWTAGKLAANLASPGGARQSANRDERRHTHAQPPPNALQMPHLGHRRWAQTV